MILRNLERGDASRYLASRADEQASSPEYSCFGAGENLHSSAALPDLVRRLDRLIERVEGSGSLHTSGVRFDAGAAEIVHRALRLSAREAAEAGFWRYLACVDFFELILWRHSAGENGLPSPRHFGIDEKWECVPRILWFRAEVVFDETLNDPYELSRRGGADFWQSGLIRRLHACSRAVSRALVRFQFPEEGEFLSAGGYRPQTLEHDAVRELYKRLRQVHATTSLVCLSDEEADEAVMYLARDLSRQP